VGTTPPPNRFSSTPPPNRFSSYSQSQYSSQRKTGRYYCKHCESQTGCHNSMYGRFLEDKIGNTNKTGGPMSDSEVYRTFLETYQLVRDFNSHNDIMERNKKSVVGMLPYCMYVGTFKRCLTNHVVANQHVQGYHKSEVPSAQDRFSHLNWVRTRSNDRAKQAKDAKRRSRKRSCGFH
jgi:hypothetical protein